MVYCYTVMKFTTTMVTWADRESERVEERNQQLSYAIVEEELATGGALESTLAHANRVAGDVVPHAHHTAVTYVKPIELSTTCSAL